MDQIGDMLLLLVPFALVWLIARNMVSWCVRQGMVAGIDDRRSHNCPTPHGGGLSMVVVAVPLGLLAVWMLQPPYGMFLNALLLSSLLVAAVGWMDDRHELSARMRLAVHLLAVGIGLVCLPPMFDFMPLWLDKLVLLLAWGWFVNLYNFMDGADGRAASEGAFIALALGILVPDFKPLALVVAGASLGFLGVNWQPAKVFMGDVGSTWLGYVLGGLLLVACADDTWRVAWPLAAVTLVFTADASWTLVRRIYEGHRPWVPHREFWFQRMLRVGYSHSQLAWRVMGVNIILLAVALLGYVLDLGVVTLIIAMIVIVFFGWRIRALEKKAFGR